MININLRNLYLYRSAFLALFGALLICSKPASAVITIDTVLVGNPGNANDAADGDGAVGGVQNFGAVENPYRIGKYEVTIGQYTAFLNAVAKTDTYGLYKLQMASNLHIAGISRSGASGSYSYSVLGSADHPITYVSWGDAARFANWLHNGQPIGEQNAGTTENGAYELNGAITYQALSTVSRKANAKWFIPTENQWYKAAFYRPAAQGGDADNYWNYPMRTNSPPYSDQPPGATPDNTRVGNFYDDDGLANGYNDGFAVNGSPSFSLDPNQNYLTDVGAYTSSPSFYGTFDQAGNVMEWNETKIESSFRGMRGAGWFDNSSYATVNYRRRDYPSAYYDSVGFRMATIVPEPTAAVLAVAVVGFICRLRKRLPASLST